jgi:ribonuclease E
MLQALADKRIGRRDQANAWIWQLAEYTREIHEEYAVQRWPETKRLLGLLVNSSGAAHARNARRLVHAARKQDRRLAAALLAAALAHTPEAQQALDGARTRMSRKPSALARELLRNFPKGRRRGRQRRRKGAADANGKSGKPETARATTSTEEAPTEQAPTEEAPTDEAPTDEAPTEDVLDEALVAADDDDEEAEAPLADEQRGELEETIERVRAAVEADEADEADEATG